MTHLLRTFAPQACDESTTLAAMTYALERLLPHRRRRFLTLLGLFESPLFVLLLIGRAAPFSKLDLRSRERLLLRMAHSPLAPLRTGFQAFKRLCLFHAYGSSDAAGRNPLWTAIGYPGPRQDRLEAETSDTPALARTGSAAVASDTAYDAVVVGSGAGGGVAAAMLARQGRRVIVLEAGPDVSRDSLTQREVEMMDRLYLESARASSADLGIIVLAGSCVGGGTTVNMCTSLRLPEVIAAEWKVASGGVDFGSTLTAHFDAVADRLALAPAREHNLNNAVIARGCDALGWNVGNQPRNASGCGSGCGYCQFGCSYGHKRSTAATYLRDAESARAAIVSSATVRKVLLDDGRARGVKAEIDGRATTIRAPLVVVAAGSLRSPGILARSGVRSWHLGRHLRLHPTAALMAAFDDPIEAWHGPMQTAYSDQFGYLDGAYGARFETVPVHPGLAGLAMPWLGRDSHESGMRRARHLAALIALSRDRGEGRVGLDERADIFYDVDARDARVVLRGTIGLARVALAAGARKASTLHQPAIEIGGAPTEAEWRVFEREIERRGCRSNRLAMFSAHQMGTCRMHRDPALGVVDEVGAVHGLRGLVVADASVFPHSSGVNPMLTIMAIAHRSIEAIV